MNDTCRRFDALIARSGQLTTEEAAELDAHLAGCGSCRELARAPKPVNDDAAFAATRVTETADDTLASGTSARGAVAADRARPRRSAISARSDKSRLRGLG